MLKTFRMLSLLEGASLVTLLFIAMPARYHFGDSSIVWSTGMLHGVLWLAYGLLSLIVSHKERWSVAFWALVLIASVIPFACLFLDRRLDLEPAAANA